jgi:hypothetical protein
MSTPIAGNQNFTNVFDLSRQLPTLSVTSLEANSASVNSGDIVQLTHGDDPARTTVFGTVTAADDGIGYYSFLVKGTSTPLVLPENTEVFSLRYVCPDADFVDSGSPILIGLGDINVPNITVPFVVGGTDAIANATTGGYVQGTVLAGATQAFGGSGDGGASSLIVNVPAPPDNQVLVRVAADAVGTIEITVEYVLRREFL